MAAKSKKEAAVRDVQTVAIRHKSLPIRYVENNTGQISGLPKNPRFIRDERFAKLVKSIQDDPELLIAQPVIVYPLAENRYVSIAGNMRLRACRELKWPLLPSAIAAPNTPAEKLRAYAMKTNIAYGEHDFELLANEWDQDDLVGWGLDVDFSADAPDVEFKEYAEDVVNEVEYHECPECHHKWPK